jgi:hypothetical protein
MAWHFIKKHLRLRKLVLNCSVLHENTGNSKFVTFKTGLIEDRDQEGPFQF